MQIVGKIGNGRKHWGPIPATSLSPTLQAAHTASPTNLPATHPSTQRPTNPQVTQEQMDQLTNSLKNTHTDVQLSSQSQSSFPSTSLILKLCFPNPLAEKEWETDGQGRGLEMLGWGSRYCGAGAGGAGDMTITSSSGPFPSLPWRMRAARCR